jgi:hypothetical protein
MSHPSYELYSELRCCVLVGQKQSESGGKSCSLFLPKLEEWNETLILIFFSVAKD